MWPWHPKPQPDELLSSWLMRIIRDYGVRPHFFCKSEWPGVQIWTRDLDKLAPESVLEGLSKRTGTHYTRVYETTLRAYEGRAFTHWNPNGNTRWILALGIYHRLHRLPGLQFCPCCLAEDEKPYFRRLWRMGYATACTVHSCRLIERCRCGEPINFHQIVGPLIPLTTCYRCGYDVRGYKSIKEDDECFYEVVKLQRAIEQAVSRKKIQITASLLVPSTEYLDVLRQLLSILARPIRGRSLGGRLARILGYPEPSDIDIFPVCVERLANKARHQLLALVAPLMKDWPEAMCALCKESRIWKTDLEKDALNLPKWFKAVTESLLGAL